VSKAKKRKRRSRGRKAEKPKKPKKAKPPSSDRDEDEPLLDDRTWDKHRRRRGKLRAPWKSRPGGATR
jgi:hypothetical protein